MRYCAAIVRYFLCAKNDDRWWRWWMLELLRRRQRGGHETMKWREWVAFFFGVTWIGKTLDSAQYLSFSLTLRGHAISHWIMTLWDNVTVYLWSHVRKETEEKTTRLKNNTHSPYFIFSVRQKYERWKCYSRIKSGNNSIASIKKRVS